MLKYNIHLCFSLFNDSKNDSTQNDNEFKIDIVNDNYVFKSDISFEENQSLSYVLPEPSKEYPYTCCGHFFYNQHDIKLHKESHRQQNSDQCDYQQLNGSVNLTVGNKCEKSRNSLQTDTQTSLPLNNSTNLAAVNKNIVKEKSTVPDNVLEFSTSHPIEFIVNQILEKQKKLGQHDNTQQLKSVSCVTDLTANKKCDDQKKSNQCSIQQSAKSPDVINGFTINQNCNVQHNTDKFDLFKLPSSITIEIIPNKKTPGFSDLIDLTVDEESNESDHTQQLSCSDLIKPVNISYFADQQRKSNICNRQKTESLQYHILDTIDLTCNENHYEPNKTDKCDKQNTDLQHDTHQIELTDTTVLTNNQNSDNQSKSNLCNTELLKENDFFDFTTCELSFRNKIVMKFRKKPKNDLYKCDICHLSFFASYEFLEHVKIHEPKKIYTCKFCKREFSIKSDMKIHLKKTHKKHYKCDSCKEVFNKKSDFICHIQTHVGYKPFKCTKCKMSFNRKSQHLLHKRKHSVETTNDCHLCLRTFIHESSLKKHLVTHSQKILFWCNTCNRCFIKKSNLVSHVQTHIGEVSHEDRTNCKDKAYNRPVESSYQCNICNKLFKTHPSLLNHIKAHKVYTKHQCKVCCMYFTKKCLLNTHTKMLH